jgi:hypothetical protein
MFCLTLDDDGHWYVIPDDKRDAFNEWVESEDVECGLTPPDWAVPVGGSPTRVRFRGFSIG